jgi:polysaccharide export outer membrane protein
VKIAAEENGRKHETRYIVPEVPAPQKRDYAIGGKDILKIVVFEEPDLSKDEVRVSIDGFITFPLIGRVRAEGLTANELEKEMVHRLGKDFLVNPQVTVQVKEFASKTVNVLGAVKTPGAISLQGPTTLLETLARAGGVNVEVAGRSIVVLRPLSRKNGDEREVKHITINLTHLMKGGDLSQNILLQDKDTVFIPQADQIFVFGEVKNPGPYKLREKTISVVEAITMAGGPTRLGATNRTRIVRVEGSEERVINVNVEDITKGDKSKDIALQSGDIIVVPETYF